MWAKAKVKVRMVEEEKWMYVERRRCGETDGGVAKEEEKHHHIRRCSPLQPLTPPPPPNQKHRWIMGFINLYPGVIRR